MCDRDRGRPEGYAGYEYDCPFAQKQVIEERIDYWWKLIFGFERPLGFPPATEDTVDAPANEMCEDPGYAEVG